MAENAVSISNPSSISNPTLAAVKDQADKENINLSNPLDQNAQKGQADSEFLKNIVSTETGKMETLILDEAPEIDTSLLQELPPPKSLLLLILKIFFTIILVGSLAAFLFFTSQLTNRLDFVIGTFNLPNVFKELALNNSEIISLQTDLNLYRYLKINGLFTEFTKDSDSYLQNFEISRSQTASKEDKTEASNEVKELKKSLKKSFSEIQKLFVENFVSPLIDKNLNNESDLQNLYKQKLTAAIEEKLTQLNSTADPQARRDYKAYLQSKALVANSEIKDLVLKTDFSAMEDQALYDFIKKLNALIVNDLSIIRQIKELRIKWSDVINEIDLRTKAVDKHFSQDSYEALGGVIYNNYDFEASQRQISITGETKVFDTKNFTLIADLIDSINKSRFFKNAEMRSFSKSGSLEEGYTATLKLSFNLQESEEISEEDEDLEVTKKTNL